MYAVVFFLSMLCLVLAVLCGLAGALGLWGVSVAILAALGLLAAGWGLIVLAEQMEMNAYLRFASIRIKNRS